MNWLAIFFLISFGVIFYAFPGHGIVLYGLVRLKRISKPHYFCFMNYAVLMGLSKYLAGNPKVTCYKAQRKVITAH